MAEVGSMPVEGEPPQRKKPRVGVESEFTSSLWNDIEIHPEEGNTDDSSGILDSETSGMPIPALENHDSPPGASGDAEVNDLGVFDEAKALFSNPMPSPLSNELVDSIEMANTDAVKMKSTNQPRSSDRVSSPANKDNTEAEEDSELVTTANKTESPESSSDEVEIIQTDIQTGATGKKRKSAHQRRNIKEIIGQDKLDERTIAAQREEWARRERMAAKRQALGRNVPPLTLQQMMEKFSSTASQVIMTPVMPDSETRSVQASSSVSKPAVGVIEHEVLTLSSDDEECVPTAPSKNDFNSQPPPLYPYRYGEFVSDTCRSRHSGGTMIVPSESERLGLNAMPFDSETDKSKVIDDDSDDDCVVLSPGAEEIDDDKDEDELNVPDHLGRILINVGHPPEDPDIFLAPLIAKTIKPHQIGGIRFMYDNVIESLETFNTSPGLGCILAHSMGLGKTIQAAAFCDIFLNYTSGNTVLVIVPINTIQNWLNEFNQWLPAANCSEPSSSPATPKKRGRKKVKVEADPTTATKEREPNAASASASPEISDPDETLDGEKPDSSSASRSYNVFLLNETVKNLAGREKIISEWSTKRGVLLIGYEMYRMLALKKLKRTGKKISSLISNGNGKVKRDEDEASLERIYSCLVSPGPDLVICDEGHRIKNSGASISQALKAIKTKRRIVLTGYPLQNNLMEYWCMVDFIRPSYLGTKNEFSNMFERPIINGQCTDSTSSDKRLMQFRSHVLHSVLEGFVQRRSHLVLQRALPPKEEWVFLVKMTPVQTKLYSEFISYIKLMAEMGTGSPNPIKAFAICCKIWNHPDVLYNVAVAKKDKASLFDDLEELAEDLQGLKKKIPRKKTKNDDSPLNNDSPSNGGLGLDCFSGMGLAEDCDSYPAFDQFTDRQGSGSYSNSREAMKDALLSLEWAVSALQDYKPNVLENGTKFELLFIIIEECVKVGDKLLVFSQSLLTLDLIELFLGMKFQWQKNRDYFRLDGSTSGLERERLVKEFNGDGRPELRVFLVSTRAGSLGINLIGANRVVVFDASWNPCHDCQAVCRIYRYGQKKRCQIYRFVTDCTLEKKIYDRQITKRGMANRVVDEMNPDSHFNSKDMSGSLILDLNNLLELNSVHFKHNPEKYTDSVMQQLLIRGGSQITKEPFEHESLLIDRKDKKLSAAERRLALRNYEMEKKAVANQGFSGSSLSSSRQSYSSYYPPKYPYSNYASSSWSNGSSEYSQGSYPPNPYPYETPSTYPLDQRSSSNRALPPQDPYLPPEFVESNKRVDPTPPVPLPVDELRKKGVCVQGIHLKKDSFLQDPEGGPDIFLMAGQRVYLLRSTKGTYLRIANGRVIAIRKRGRGAAQSVLDNVPPTQDLSKEQIYVVINSILRPKISSTLAHLQEYAQGGFSSSPRQSYSSGMSQYSNYLGSHPVSVPLPPSYPYGQFPNQQNLQITNHNSSSGGDVTIWRKDASEPAQPKASNDIIPEIEVIKINPPRKEVSDLDFLNQLSQKGRSMNHSNTSYSGRSSRSYYPQESHQSLSFPPPNPATNTLIPADMELLESITPMSTSTSQSSLSQALTSRSSTHASSSRHQYNRRLPQTWKPNTSNEVPAKPLQTPDPISSIFPNLNFKDIEISRPVPPSYPNLSELMALPGSLKSSSSTYEKSPSFDMNKFQTSKSSLDGGGGGTTFRRGDIIFETGSKIYGNGTSGSLDNPNILYDNLSNSNPSSSQFGQYYSENENQLFPASVETELLTQELNN